MAKEFKIVREVELPATPEQVWDAIATGPGVAAWLWPMEIEPRLGGEAELGGVTAWEPPHHFAARAEGENGWFNALEMIIEAREGGAAWMRYVHNGIFVDDWDNQYDGADKHTDFYLHTLGQYLRYFTGRYATYASADGPEASKDPRAMEVLAQALGLREDAREGDRVHVELPGLAPLDAVVDYRNPYFIGLRTDDAMYRVFGRNHWGAPVSVVVHHFGDVDQKETQQALQSWLESVYA